MSNQRSVNFARNQSTVLMSRSLLTLAREAVAQRSANAASVNDFDLEGHGWRRVTMVAEVSVPASGQTVYVIDDTQDYRDRMVLLLGPFAASGAGAGAVASAIYPGHDNDTSFNNAASDIREIYYTGSGYVTPTVAGDVNYSRVLGSDQYVLLYARSTDGALVIASLTGNANATRMSFLLQLMVSPKIGERTLYNPQVLSDFASVNSAALQPHDLNALQDPWHMSQTPPSADTLPLGKLTESNPPLALEFNVRGEHVRQPLLTPSLTRFVSLAAPADADTLVDDTQDYRDRLVSIFGVVAGTDIRPGEVDEDKCGTFAGSSTQYMATGYTGDGNDAAGSTDYKLTSVGADGFFYARSDTGHLYYSTDGVAADYVVVMLSATPQLGPRSQLTVDTGLDIPTPLEPPNGILVDGLSEASEGLAARYRMDRGMTPVAGRIAAIADQSGNGRHLVQHDHEKRCAPPEPVLDALGTFGLPFTGVEFYEMVDAFGGDGFHLYFALRIGMASDTILFGPATGTLPEDPDTALAVFTSGSDVTAYLGSQTNIGAGQVASEWASSKVATLGVNVRVDGSTLVVDMAWRDSGGATSGPSLVSPSPDIESVTALINMLFYGFDGHALEFAAWDRPMANADDIIAGTYSTTRYGV